MTQSDVLSSLKEQVRAELDEAADEHIERLVEKFRSELVRNKNSLIAGLLNGIDILTNSDEVKRETTFQINIKAEGVITMPERRLIDAYDLAETIENMRITVAGKPARWNDAKYSVLREISEADTVIEIPESGIGDLSDGYHTFNELYHHRAILFSVICNSNPQIAWKSKLHDTGDMFDGMFIVGIETPQGQATYHYDINPYWDMFKVKELPNAPKWDGHSPEEAIRRIGTLRINNAKKPIEKFPFHHCPSCNTVVSEHNKFCSECGKL